MRVGIRNREPTAVPFASVRVSHGEAITSVDRPVGGRVGAELSNTIGSSVAVGICNRVTTAVPFASVRVSHGEVITSVYRPVGGRVGAELSSILSK